VSEPREPTEQRAAAGDDGLVVTSSPRSVALTRRYVVDACVAYGWSASSDTVALLTSEVVTNSVLHAYGPQVRVRVLDRGLRLRVEVFDGSPVLPVPRKAPTSAVNGRGIALVDELALAWGVDVHPDGKTLWFEVGV
jgi:anti-sigma regulatory factor (Ser/Thr protein kinase)